MMNRLRICALMLAVLMLAVGLAASLAEDAAAGMTAPTGDVTPEAVQAVEGDAASAGTETPGAGAPAPETAPGDEALPQAAGPGDETPAVPADEPVAAPADEAPAAPADGTAAEPEGETVAEPADEAVPEPVDEVVAEPADEALAAPVDEASGSERPVLYVVLADCGTTLFGKASKNAIVDRPGDPEGTLLSLIAAAPPLLCPGANIAVFGYHSELVGMEGLDVAPMSDTQAVCAQVKQLLDIEEKQRVSSNLVGALNALNERWLTGRQWAQTYDCRLVILTGGAMYFATEKAGNPTAADIRRNVEALRGMGVRVAGFGYDLAGSDDLNRKENQEAAGQLLINAEQFGPGAYTAVPMAVGEDSGMARLKYAVRLLDYFAGEGGYAPSENLDRSQAQPQAERVYVLWDGETHRYQGMARGESCGLSPATTLESAKLVRYCDPAPSAQEAQAPEADPVEQALELVSGALDGDGDGMLDGEALRGGTEANRPCPGMDPAIFTVISTDPNVVDVKVEDGALTLSPGAAGEATLEITPVDAPERALKLRAVVRDFRLTWYIEADEALQADRKPVRLVSCADGALRATLERLGRDGTWTTADGGAADVSVEGNALGAALNKQGAYRVTAWTELDGEKVTEPEVRTFSAALEFDPVADIALVAPYFKQQEGQRVSLTVGGEPVDLEGFTAATEPASLADVYLDAGKGCLYIVPGRAGEGRVTLSDDEGGECLSFNLKVNSLTKRPLLWILVAVIPVCLIGLTAMVVILIMKLRNR